MADYRQIHTEIWGDPWFEILPPNHKLLYIYLFSNTRACLAGLYDISLRLISFETGLEEPAITEALTSFEKAEKVYYQDGTIWIPKMIERNANNLRSPKTQANIKATFLQARDHPLTRKAIAHYNGILCPKYGIDTLSIPYLQYNTDNTDNTDNHGRADAPPDGGMSDNSSQSPSSLEEWLQVLQDSKNRTAVLVNMCATLFPGRDPPDYSYTGKVAREARGAGRLAALLWQAAGQRITGDPLPYCQQMIKKGGNHRGKGEDSPITIQGHTPTAARPEEFYTPEELAGAGS